MTQIKTCLNHLSLACIKSGAKKEKILWHNTFKHLETEAYAMLKCCIIQLSLVHVGSSPLKEINHIANKGQNLGLRSMSSSHSFKKTFFQVTFLQVGDFSGPGESFCFPK